MGGFTAEGAESAERGKKGGEVLCRCGEDGVGRAFAVRPFDKLRVNGLCVGVLGWPAGLGISLGWGSAVPEMAQ